MINRRRKTSLTKYFYLSLYCKGSKGLFKVYVWEGVGDRTETSIFWPPLLWPSTLCLSRFLMLNRTPWGPLCWVLAFFTASYQHLLWTPIHQGPKALRPGMAFLTTSSLQLATTLLARRTQLSYILVRRPFDLWNRIFNRHQAEITVMQFTGHSLPVHQSMSVPWKFFSLSHFICQFPPTRFPLITAIGMCHFLPVQHLGMAFLIGSKGQNTTILLYSLLLSNNVIFFGRYVVFGNFWGEGGQ